MKTLQEKYTGVREGKFSKAQWLKEAKLTLPHLISPYNGFDDAVRILKNKSMIHEEVKADLKKTDKSVEDINAKSFSYGEMSAANVNFDQMLKGMQIEIEKDPEMSEEKAREKAIKNLLQDPYFYLKNQAFGIEGIGYTEDAPGLKPSKTDQMEKVKLKENIRKLIKTTLLSEGYSKEKAMKIARVESEGGFVQHVNRLSNGMYRAEDWYDSDNTVATYEDGELVRSYDDLDDLDESTLDYGTDYDNPYDDLYADRAADAKALKLYDEGEMLFRKGDMEEAEELRQQALSISDWDEEDLPPYGTLNESKAVSSRLKEIEAETQILALERKIEAISEEISERNHKISAVDEMDMKDMINPAKVKELQKEIKLLEKEKSKMEKMMEKLSKKGKKKVVTAADKDEDMVPDDKDMVDENSNKGLTYDNFVQMVRDDMMAGAAPDEYPSDERVRKDAKYLYNQYLQGASVDDLFW